MNKAIHPVSPLIEFLLAAGLGIFFHWVLRDPGAAYVIFGVGILLSLATYLLRQDVASLREGLVRQYQVAHEITFAVARIPDPDCQARAQEVLSAAKKDLSQLQHGYIPLDETEFYHAAARAVEQASSEVKAVDPMTEGWDTRGALVNFYQANLRAIARGVRVTRIFVVPREALASAEVQRVLLTQAQHGIDVRVAYRDELPSSGDGAGWADTCSFDFALYDDRVATDVFRTPGRYHGRKTSRPEEVLKYRRNYELIEHNSHPVALEGDRACPTGVH